MPPRKKIILIVDDSKTIRDIMKVHLMGHGYEFLTATSGVSGLEMARHHVPNLIISDIMMPEMDGVAFCLAMKNDPSLCHIPIIVSTMKKDESLEKKVLQAGACAFFRKPVNSEELDGLVASLLGD